IRGAGDRGAAGSTSQHGLGSHPHGPQKAQTTPRNGPSGPRRGPEPGGRQDMKRLLEQEPSDLAAQRLTDPVRGARPFELNPFRKRQIWVQLTSATARKTRRPPWVLAALGAGVLLIGGSAAAALGWLPGMGASSVEEEGAPASFGEPALSAPRAESKAPPATSDQP